MRELNGPLIGQEGEWTTGQRLGSFAFRVQTQQTGKVIPSPGLSQRSVGAQ